LAGLSGGYHSVEEPPSGTLIGRCAVLEHPTQNGSITAERLDIPRS